MRIFLASECKSAETRIQRHFQRLYAEMPASTAFQENVTILSETLYPCFFLSTLSAQTRPYISCITERKAMNRSPHFW